jgi:hypothetical protein
MNNLGDIYRRIIHEHAIIQNEPFDEFGGACHEILFDRIFSLLDNERMIGLTPRHVL